MLRYFYLLSLLICINIGFCYEYSRENGPSNRLCNRKVKDNMNPRHRRPIAEERRFRKRRNHDTDYDKDSMAQIDVASFIKNPEEQSFEENDPYEPQLNEMNTAKYYNDYGFFIEKDANGKMGIKLNEDYSEIDSDNVQDYTGMDPNFAEKEENNKPRAFGNIIKNKMDSELGRQISRHYQAKKGALKNFKLPFFSHDKSTTAKEVKERKRKAHAFKKLQKENEFTIAYNGNIENQNNAHKKPNVFLNKRSYIEKICPFCQRRFIANKKRVINYFNTRKSSYDRNTESSVTQNSADMNTNENLDISYLSEETNFETPIRERRRKRDDNRNIERQKELEELEKRVESVPVNSPSFNKAVQKS